MMDCSFGWCSDVPDLRDWELPREHERDLPDRVDLRDYELSCIEGEIAGPLHSDCATSLIRLLDWQSKKWEGRRLNGSVDFLYLLTKEIWGGGGMTGVSLRSTLKTLRRFGTPPARMCGDLDVFSLLRRPELYCYGHQFEGIEYMRLDPWSQPKRDWLKNMKFWIANGNPFLIGFAVPHNISRHSVTVPFDAHRGGTLGGTACLVMGFDDEFPVFNDVRTRDSRAPSEMCGAFIIQTNWGTEWGDGGCLWLPYIHVETGFARDAWAVLNRDTRQDR